MLNLIISVSDEQENPINITTDCNRLSLEQVRNYAKTSLVGQATRAAQG